jgi:uncharacterized membrane protein YgdD (TMEM256/DUF423 family)
MRARLFGAYPRGFPEAGISYHPNRMTTLHPSQRLFGLAGALSGALAVAAGAFATHALRGALSVDALANWETGARYQMYHALALLLVAWLAGQRPGRPTRIAGWAFIAGTILFSGSLYLLSLTGLRWLGALAPFGGAALIGGWLALAWSWLRG